MGTEKWGRGRGEGWHAQSPSPTNMGRRGDVGLMLGSCWVHVGDMLGLWRLYAGFMLGAGDLQADGPCPASHSPCGSLVCNTHGPTTTNKRSSETRITPPNPAPARFRWFGLVWAGIYNPHPPTHPPTHKPRPATPRHPPTACMTGSGCPSAALRIRNSTQACWS